MILPHTHTAVLILTILSALCWGSWASAYKLTRAWRFELYYFDFAIGFGLCALICAFTWGNLGYDGFKFLDDTLNAGKREWALAIGSGALFNLANLLLLAAISVAGMAVAFPAWLGVGVVVGVILKAFAGSGENPALLVAGGLLALGAILADFVMYRAIGVLRHERLARAGAVKSTRRPAHIKGIVLAMAGGLLLAFCFPLLNLAMAPDIGLGPYAVSVFFAVGLVFSTAVFNLFFMNLPVAGEPVEIFEFFKGEPRNHLLGIAGGALLCGGLVASQVAATANAQTGVGAALPAGAAVSAGLLYFLAQAAAPVAALWGILKWKDLQDGDARVKMLAGAMLALFVGAVALVSLASAFAAKT
jgi:glucose uptake protein